MKPRFRLKWDKFLCWILGHKWIDSAGEDDEYLEGALVSTWRVCLRCASVKKEFYPPAGLPNCLCPMVSNEDFEMSIEEAANRLAETFKKGGKDGKN